MKLFGVTLLRPTSRALTLAAAIALLIWLPMHVVIDSLAPITAAAALVVIGWGALCIALGLRFRQLREALFFAAGCAVLLALLHALASLYAPALAATGS